MNTVILSGRFRVCRGVGRHVFSIVDVMMMENVASNDYCNYVDMV